MQILQQRNRFSALFSHLPADTGLAFVVIQHLDPSRPSLLTQLLGTETRMPDALVASLTDMGARVRGEPSAAAGLAAVAEFMPQVILCDLAMPGEDG